MRKGSVTVNGLFHSHLIGVYEALQHKACDASFLAKDALIVSSFLIIPQNDHEV